MNLTPEQLTKLKDLVATLDADDSKADAAATAADAADVAATQANAMATKARLDETAARAAVATDVANLKALIDGLTV